MRDMKDILRTDPLLWPSARGISKNKQDKKKKRDEICIQYYMSIALPRCVTQTIKQPVLKLAIVQILMSLFNSILIYLGQIHFFGPQRGV